MNNVQLKCVIGRVSKIPAPQEQREENSLALGELKSCQLSVYMYFFSFYYTDTNIKTKIKVEIDTTFATGTQSL